MSDGFKALKLYNTLTRRDEEFVPLDPANVRMYVCGPTVYDFAHIGNARPVIVFDVLFRLLRQLYGDDHVTYVRNITDVDDKINARALRDFGEDITAGRLTLNEAIRRVTERTAAQFHADVAALGCLAPTHEPRATEFVLPRTDGKADMASLIQTLIDRGHAYAAKGEILFDTASMPDYGQLSKRRLEDQQAGARVAVDPHKRNPSDFVLWKESSAEEPGWEGRFTFEGKPLVIRGRPGWHIECSAMSAAYLGEVFDIHGGGLDLIFPHHENEIAQSRCAHGTPVMANYWLHNGFVQVEGKKMAKSEGNFVTIHDLLATENFGGRKWPGEVLRLAILMTHYREPLDFSLRKLEEAEAVLDGWYRVVGDAKHQEGDSGAVRRALLDDLGTPAAITVLHDLRAQAARGSEAAKADLKANAVLLGLLTQSQDQWFSGKAADAAIDEAAVEERVAARLSLLRAKNFPEADRIREELSGRGIQLMDYKDPETGERRTKWEVKR
ncbi:MULTISPECIES: cysteine--tRNA ligase [Chelativorans]|jgi:cysteinyl-tRNA synthetase|uniref:Cysteine--tRNA ligase n=1 Tax=Chelativorans sp. (strain BNC1) TaxID=266779 RepID=SYC_CHESB|nr:MULTISPECIES: cysteine--tRNA ligase [Chelativorans]Q11JR3.2 RecName: Full=Cysteine--tRNA ligase; AltName: Full=Cysteinyl-tRNA synthetase; Short=CysRS [Chelativorans sp. BNC1]